MLKKELTKKKSGAKDIKNTSVKIAINLLKNFSKIPLTKINWIKSIYLVLKKQN